MTKWVAAGGLSLISKNEPHSPEIEAAIDKRNALFFGTNDKLALGNLFLEVLNNRDLWIGKRLDIVEFCKMKYSIESMSSSFISLINKNG